MGCAWNTHGLPTEAYWIPLNAHEMPVGCPWDSRRLPTGYPWATYEPPMGYRWVTGGLPTGCHQTPWDAHGMLYP